MKKSLTYLTALLIILGSAQAYSQCCPFSKGDKGTAKDSAKDTKQAVETTVETTKDTAEQTTPKKDINKKDK